MEAVRHRQAAQDLASSVSTPVLSQTPPMPAQREREVKVVGFQQWYQQVRASSRPANRHSSATLLPSGDEDGSLSRGGSVSPSLLGRGSSDIAACPTSSREEDPPKLQQQYSISLSESAIPDRTDSMLLRDAEQQQWRRVHDQGQAQGEEEEEEEGEEGEVEPGDGADSQLSSAAASGPVDSEVEDERTGITLLDSTTSGTAAAATNKMKLALNDHGAADTSSYQAALRLLDKKDPKSEITSVPKALKVLQVSADLRFDEGMNSCLRYLEAVPWSAEEEVEVPAVLRKLGLDQTKAGLRVLARLAPSTSDSVYSVLKKLLAQAVAPPTDESLTAARVVVAGVASGDHVASPGRPAPLASPGFSEPGCSPVGGRTALGHGGLALMHSHSLSHSHSTVGAHAQQEALSVAGSKRTWRGSVDKLFVGAKLRPEVRKRVLFEQLDALIDRVQACVLVEGRPGQAPQLVEVAGPAGLETAARFRVEMDNLSWLMGVMVEKLGFAEYIVKWLSEDAGFVRNVEHYSRRESPVEAAMYDPLLPVLLRLLTLMVGGHILVPTVTRYSLLKLWLPVLAGIPRLPANLSRERGRLFGELLGQLIVTLPMAQQEEVLDVWLSLSGGKYNTWLDMAAFLERWLERASKRLKD